MPYVPKMCSLCIVSRFCNRFCNKNCNRICGIQNSLFHIIPVFGIPSIPNTYQYLRPRKSEILKNWRCFVSLTNLNSMASNNEYIPHLLHIIRVFGISSIPNTDQYLGSRESQTLIKRQNAVRCVSKHT